MKDEIRNIKIHATMHDCICSPCKACSRRMQLMYALGTFRDHEPADQQLDASDLYRQDK